MLLQQETELLVFRAKQNDQPAHSEEIEAYFWMLFQHFRAAGAANSEPSLLLCQQIEHKLRILKLPVEVRKKGSSLVR